MASNPFQMLNELLKDIQPQNSILYNCHVGSPISECNIDIRNGAIQVLNQTNLAPYPHPRHTDILFESVFGYLSRSSGVPIEALTNRLDFTVTSGTREAIFSLACFAKQTRPHKTTALVPSPCYPGYVGSSLAAGLDVQSIDLTAESGFLVDIDRIAKETLDSTAVIFLTNPGNPFGFHYSDEHIDKIISVCRTYDIVCVFDECFAGLNLEQTQQSTTALRHLAKNGPVFVIQSLSKRSNLAGLRSGFIVANHSELSQLDTLRRSVSPTVPNFIQDMSAAAWADDLHVQQNAAEISQKVDLATSILGEGAFICPDSGFFINVHCENEEFLTRELYHYGVKVMPVKYLSHQNGTFGQKEQGLIRLGLVYELEKTKKILNAVKYHLN